MQELIAVIFAFAVCTFALYKLLYGYGGRNGGGPRSL